MQTIYQLKWEINGEAKYAAFHDKDLAEQMSEHLSKLSKSLGVEEIKFEANVISLYVDAEDFAEAFADHISDKENPLFSLN